MCLFCFNSSEGSTTLLFFFCVLMKNKWFSFSNRVLETPFSVSSGVSWEGVEGPATTVQWNVHYLALEHTRSHSHTQTHTGALAVLCNNVGKARETWEEWLLLFQSKHSPPQSIRGDSFFSFNPPQCRTLFLLCVLTWCVFFPHVEPTSVTLGRTPHKSFEQIRRYLGRRQFVGESVETEQSEQS